MNYVQGDSRPPLRFRLESGGAPIDVSAGGITVRAYVRLAGAAVLKDTLVGVKSTGNVTAVDPDTCAWTVDVNPPYNVAGFGGIVFFNPSPTTFDQPGAYEAEIEIDYGGGIRQTVNRIERINVRAHLA